LFVFSTDLQNTHLLFIVVDALQMLVVDDDDNDDDIENLNI